MISKSASLSQLPSANAAAPDFASDTPSLPERLSLRSCVLLIAGVSTLLWVGVAMIADRLFG